VCEKIGRQDVRDYLDQVSRNYFEKAPKFYSINYSLAKAWNLPDQRASANPEVCRDYSILQVEVFSHQVAVRLPQLLLGNSKATFDWRTSLFTSSPALR